MMTIACNRTLSALILVIVTLTISCTNERSKAINELEQKGMYSRSAFLAAVEDGNNDSVKLFIKAGINIDNEMPYEDPPLSHALRKGHIETMKLLLDGGADINAGDFNSLMWASQSGNNEAVKLLVSRGADVNRKNSDGQTALLAAARGNHIEIAKLLISKGANVNSKAQGLQGGWTPILNAAYEGHAEMIKLLVEAGAPVNETDVKGNSPLLWAVCRGHVNAAKQLISLGADVNIKNAKGLSALSCAKDDGKSELSQLLLSSGSKSDTTATLLQALITCDDNKVREILPRGSDANVKIATSMDSDKNWRSPLIISAEKGCVESVKYLLDIGANPNISNGGFTPLVYAASNGNLDMVTTLIAKGADVNLSGACENDECFHWTPLSYAALNGHIKVVRFLLEKGADVNAMVYDDVEGDAGSALMFASSAGHLEIVKLLLDKDADVSKSDYMENTALIWAAASGRTQIVAELIAKGADVNKKSWDGTALALARKRKQPDAALIKMLIDAGATEMEDNAAKIDKIDPETRAKRMKDMQLKIEQRAAQEAKSQGFDIYAYKKDMLNKSSVRVIRILGKDYIFIVKKFRPEVVIPLWCLLMLMCGLLSYKNAVNKNLDKRFWLIVGAFTAPFTLLYIYFIPKRK